MTRHLPHFFGGHRGGGLGRFGRGFKDGDGMGARAFGMGRKLKSIDLQLLILGLLADKPRHGYEIIKALDERSQGYYVPSPGMVYPALTHLEELGRATVEADGTRKLYHITEAGRQYLDEHRALADALLAQIGRVAQRMERVRRALNAEEDALNDQGRYSKDLLRARRELKSALADTWASSAEEQRRIAAILERAAADIRGEHSRA
ncbi:MAG: PadR family transcriptional regulator [Steroidobacteraceae bacterium]